jgi:hypothetical protein
MQLSDDGIGAEASAIRTLDLKTTGDRRWSDKAQHQ